MPSRFTGPLRVEHVDADWRQWRLLEPLVWEEDYKGSMRTVTIPAGFIFDGATTPRWIWTFLPPTGSYMRAAGLHDWYLECIAKQENVIEWVPTRSRADRQFRKAMLAVGVSWPVAWIMYFGVRVGSLWSKLRKKKP